MYKTITSWHHEIPREEISPRFEKTENGFNIYAENDLHSFGKWVGTVDKLDTNSVYSIDLGYSFETKTGKAFALFTWVGEDKTMISRDYFTKTSDNCMSISMECPKEATSLKIELCFYSSCCGMAHFDNPTIQLSQKRAHRIVNVATSYIRFDEVSSFGKNLEQILMVLDKAGHSENKPDILCFTETAYDRCVPILLKDKAICEDSEVMNLIRARAKEYGMYLVFGIHEDDRGRIFNTSYLIDDKGEIIGKYRKTHITLSEYEGGMMSGDQTPVFDTPLGRIGLMICWDQWFPEMARMLYTEHPDILFLQTAGDTDCQIRSRAADNGAYAVVSGVIEPSSSKIINPRGDIIAHVESVEQGYVSATIDLDEKFYQYWLSVGEANGEGKTIYANERRNDLYKKLCKLM